VQTSLVKQKDAKLVGLQGKPDKLFLFHAQDARSERRRSLARPLDQARSTPQRANSCAADSGSAADTQSQRARGQIGKYEMELAEVRAELEAKKSELEAVHLRPTDAENGLAKSKAEADALRARNDAGTVNGNGVKAVEREKH
jgi:uncharacterized membrane protein YqiK